MREIIISVACRTFLCYHIDMLTYELNAKNKYLSLYSAIRGDILAGKLTEGQKLPSKRALASNLGVSVMTVQTAYEQLLAEGYIVSRERSGYFVSGGVSGRSVEVRGIEEHASPADEYAFDLVGGSSPPELFPFSVWAKLMRKVLSEEGDHLLCRVPCRGDFSLRCAIADYLNRMRGVVVQPERIVVGAGAEYLYGIIVQLLGRDKLFAVENPGHLKIASSYVRYGARCAFIPVGNDGVDVGAVECSGADAVHISPSHQFPTGSVIPAAARLRIIAWARLSGAYIVEDDYDSEFRLSGKPLQSMLGLCPDRVIYVNTFSKSLAPSMRMGYMVLPPELVDVFLSVFSGSANVVPLFEQKTLAAMISGGYFERHIDRLKNYYRTVRSEVTQALESLPYASEVHDTGSGLHLTVTFPQASSDERIRRIAAERGVNIRCLSDYLADSHSECTRTAAINYGGLKKGWAARIAALFDE